MKIVNTLTLVEEMTTDGHSPLKFLCDDLNIYYCKYRSGVSLNKHEIDCLYYEIICNRLLANVQVPHAEIKLVKIAPNSFKKESLTRHKKFCKPGRLYLGFKEIESADVLQGIMAANSKRDFRKLLNPYDLIKIALFDLWVDNRDRGKSENYNLLLAPTNIGVKIVPFDHAFCFGGIELLRTFNEKIPVSGQDKLITSFYFSKIRQYFERQKACDIVKNFLSLQTHEIEVIISETYDECPTEWEIPTRLKDRIFTFLTNKDCLQTAQNIMYSIFK